MNRLLLVFIIGSCLALPECGGGNSSGAANGGDDSGAGQPDSEAAGAAGDVTSSAGEAGASEESSGGGASNLPCKTSAECAPSEYCNPLPERCVSRASKLTFSDVYPLLGAEGCTACHLPGGPGAVDGHGSGTPLVLDSVEDGYGALVSGGLSCHSTVGRICVDEPSSSLLLQQAFGQHGDANQPFVAFQSWADPTAQELLQWIASGARRDLGEGHCGDFSVDASEACDLGPTPPQKCAYGPGHCNVCTAACTSVAATGPACGDGVIDSPFETCDDGNAALEHCGTYACGVCGPDCHYVEGAWCGNGKREVLEACDTYRSTTLCDADCSITRQFSGTVLSQTSGTDDRAASIAVDAMGNIYVTGRGGDTPGVVPIDGDNSYLRKLDPSGKQLWVVRVPLIATYVAVSASGAVVVESGGTVALPAGNSDTQAVVSTFDTNGQAAWSDVFSQSNPSGVAIDGDGNVLLATTSLLDSINYWSQVTIYKFSAANKQLWTRSIDTSAPDKGSALAISPAGTVAVAGHTQNGDLIQTYDGNGTPGWSRNWSSADFTGPPGIAFGPSDSVFVDWGIRSGYFTDYYVDKMDSSGRLVWSAPYPNQMNGSLSGVAVNAAGEAYLTGTLVNSSTAGTNGAQLIKLDSAGTVKFNFELPGTTKSEGYAVAVGPDQNPVLAGFTRAGVSTTPAGIYGDALVRKYDSAGDPLWTDQWSGFGLMQTADRATALAVDNVGATWVGGTTAGGMTGWLLIGTQDAYVRKYDPSGILQFTDELGIAGQALQLNAVVTAAPNRVTAGGCTPAALPGATSLGAGDAFLRTYNGTGKVLSTLEWGTSGDDCVTSAAGDAAGAVLAVGTTTGAFTNLTNAGGKDVFVRKYDAAQNPLWTDEFGTTSSSDSITGVVLDADGSVVVVGSTDAALPEQTLTGLGTTDAFVRKYAAAGKILWTHQFGTAGSDAALAVAADGTDVFVAGYTTGAFPTFTNSGGEAGFVRKYDGSGTFVWDRQFNVTGGTTHNVRVTAAAIDHTHLLVLSGTVDGSFASENLLGGSDAFVRVLDSFGSIQSTKRLATTAADTASALAITPDNLIAVGGNTLGAFPGSASSGSMDSFFRVLSRY